MRNSAENYFMKQIEVKIKQFLNYRGFNFLQIDKAFESVKRNEMVDGQT